MLHSGYALFLRSKRVFCRFKRKACSNWKVNTYTKIFLTVEKERFCEMKKRRAFTFCPYTCCRSYDYYGCGLCYPIYNYFFWRRPVALGSKFDQFEKQ